ncbi:MULTISPECIES: sulfatase [unclassified Streptomyces]|uniref:sulfatase n=1 Tax=unclassified Streptomyces TaxID=2593676 RepID=UPI00278BB4C7|nr:MULTISPECIES: sulfatase [unclassified Streptomyces]
MPRAIILMFDSLNRHLLPPYAPSSDVQAPNFQRLAARSTTYDNFRAGSLPCMPARRELHTGRHNFLHRSWGPLEPFDDSMPELLKRSGVHTHLASDHPHYWEDGGATYHTRFSTWEFFRGQENDPWKGVVNPPTDTQLRGRAAQFPQNLVNRGYQPTEETHSQTRTVDAGLHFLDTNAEADDWLLQLELFDPHEPFFAPPHYRKLYPDGYDGPEFDWPPYAKTGETAAEIAHARSAYAALVTMCDRSLGRVLDFMDAHDMWSDTLLVVNTDHGFLLGEHGWWAKCVQPWYEELVHLPMFLHDPSDPRPGTRSDTLARTIDLAPTVLAHFALTPPADMQGRDLAAVARGETPPADGALFGIHGGHVNVTDGRYVYLRAAAHPSNTPLEEYTLMPTHMTSRFSVAELSGWRQAEPFSFTKGLPTMRVNAASGWVSSWTHGTLLFDVEADPEQRNPLHDDALELRMASLLCRLMRENDAPRSQFERLGLPYDTEPTAAHLLVRAQAERAAATAEPLPELHLLPAATLLARPLTDLLSEPVLRAVVERHAPELTRTEGLVVPRSASLFDLAGSGGIPSATLRALADDLAAQAPPMDAAQ